MTEKHPDGQVQQFECDFDGKFFKSKSDLYSHMRSHFSLVECQICHKKLKQFSINAHLKNFHATDKNFQCKICPKRFKSAKYLKLHEKIHNKTHKCDICSRLFSFLCHLKQHKKENHENAKSFKCEICDMNFNQKNVLKAHQKLHDKNRAKSFKCLRCDFATDNKNDFRKHQMFHDRQDQKFATMKNPVKCDKCSKFFKDKENLSYHKNKVHPKVLFQCDLCAKFIKTKTVLKIHFKNHIKSFSKF